MPIWECLSISCQSSWTYMIKLIQPKNQPLAHATNASMSHPTQCLPLTTQNPTKRPHIHLLSPIHLYTPPFPHFPPSSHLTIPSLQKSRSSIQHCQTPPSQRSLAPRALFLLLLIALPLPVEHADPVLDGVDAVADDAEDEEEADYDDGDDEVAFHHCWGWSRGGWWWVLGVESGGGGRRRRWSERDERVWRAWR